jgi:acetyl esterase/lipase
MSFYIFTAVCFSSTVELPCDLLIVFIGAYVIGDGRQDDCGFAAKNLLAHTSATHVLCPQYRLASNPGCRFPAQLQDAVTSLLYLLETMNVPASQITISGDSAGGNLCLALLRYIADNPNAAVPSPGCAFLWSPWVDPVQLPPILLQDTEILNFTIPSML